MIDRLLGRQVLVKQKALPAAWVSGLFAISVALLPLLFIPFSTMGLVVWLSVLLPVGYFLSRWTMGFASMIFRDSTGTLRLSIKDVQATVYTSIPVEWVVDYSRIEYNSWRDHADTKQDPYYRKYYLAGYTGPGLIVQYRIAKSWGGSDDVRTWRIPGPKADEFIGLINL